MNEANRENAALGGLSGDATVRGAGIIAPEGRLLRSDTRDFLGAGWSFPPRLNAQGRIALVPYEADIEEAVRLILRTRVGERPMRPEFGSRLHLLLFQPNDAATAGLARRYVSEALLRWEPRIDELNVSVGPHRPQRNEANVAVGPDRPERMVIEIAFRIRATNSERNLVYPFYLIPGEE